MRPADDSARAAVLGRVREALRDTARRSALPAPSTPRHPGEATDPGLFRHRLEDYGAIVTEAESGAVAAAVAAACRRHGARELAVPPDLPGAWLPKAVRTRSERALSLSRLDQIDGSLYGCAWAIAETGSIVLDSGPTQGTRRLSLIPDLSICVVLSSQIVADLPQLFAALAESAARRPITFVSGPSATSDIELRRVEGVHGPRRVEVVLAS